MKNRPVPYVVVLVAALTAGGCGATMSHHGLPAESTTYADALGEAFQAYEQEVTWAATQTYGSEYEAQAVARSLGPHRFDQYLRAALAERGRTMQAFATYAETHPAFARAQTWRFEGRLERIVSRAQAIADNPISRPATTHASLF